MASERTARRILWTLVAAAIAWVGVEVVWVATGEPAVVENHVAALVELAARHQPEGCDGWALFTEAGRIARFVRTDVAGTGANASPEEAAAYNRRIDEELRREGVYDLLAEAAACPRAVRPLSKVEPLWSILLPELADFRLLAINRVTSMDLAFEAGDLDEAVAAFEQLMALGRVCGTQALILDRLVAGAIFELTLRDVRGRLVAGELDAPTCRRMLEALDRQSHLAPIEVAIEAERHFGRDFVERYFTDDGHGDGHLDLSGAEDFGPPPDAVFLHAGRAATLRAIERLYDAYVQDAAMTPAQRLSQGSKATPVIAAIGASSRFSLVNLILPATSRLLDTNDDMLVKIEATRVMLALEVYRGEHGRYPQALDALVPAYLPAPPIDPTHDGAFLYRPLPGPSGAGTSYFLGSTGADGVEDTRDIDPTNLDAVLKVGESIWTEGADVWFNQ